MGWLTELIITNGYDQDTNQDLKNTSDIQGSNYLTYTPEQIVNLRVSSYIWEKETPIALQLEKESSVKVAPIYLRPFDFSNLEFSKNQMIPKDSGGKLRAISQWENTDEAFMDTAKRIREVIDSFG